MKKKNAGFVLVETLIVSVFIMALFTYLYTKIIPLSGEFEKRQYYDDLDTTYVLFHTRKLLKETNFSFPTYQCYTPSDFPDSVQSYLIDSGVNKLCIVPYQINEQTRTNLTDSTKGGFSDRAWQEYIEYLPEFSYKDETYTNFYSGYSRMIIEMSSPFLVNAKNSHDPGVRFGNLEVNP